VVSFQLQEYGGRQPLCDLWSTGQPPQSFCRNVLLHCSLSISISISFILDLSGLQFSHTYVFTQFRRHLTKTWLTGKPFHASCLELIPTGTNSNIPIDLREQFMSHQKNFRHDVRFLSTSNIWMGVKHGSHQSSSTSGHSPNENEWHVFVIWMVYLQTIEVRINIKQISTSVASNTCRNWLETKTNTRTFSIKCVCNINNCEINELLSGNG